MHDCTKLGRYRNPYLIIGQSHLQSLSDFPLDIYNNLPVGPDMAI